MSQSHSLTLKPVLTALTFHKHEQVAGHLLSVPHEECAFPLLAWGKIPLILSLSQWILQIECTYVHWKILEAEKKHQHRSATLEEIIKIKTHENVVCSNVGDSMTLVNTFHPWWLSCILFWGLWLASWNAVSAVSKRSSDKIEKLTQFILKWVLEDENSCDILVHKHGCWVYLRKNVYALLEWGRPSESV